MHFCGDTATHTPHEVNPVGGSTYKCPGYLSEQTTADTEIVAPWEGPSEQQWNELIRQVAEVHAFVNNFTAASAAMSGNPMMRAMMRNFGIDPAVFTPKTIEADGN